MERTSVVIKAKEVKIVKEVKRSNVLPVASLFSMKRALYAGLPSMVALDLLKTCSGIKQQKLFR